MHPDPSPNPPGLSPAMPVRRGRLTGRRITLCVTGSIAAFKAPVVARLLIKDGADVRTVLTRSAQQFVGHATFSGITGQPCFSDMFERSTGGESHVTWAATSDLVLIAPATADILARMATGRADDAVTALALCARCPILVAPAMHGAMWTHPATQRNVAVLESDGRVARVGPVRGEVASGEIGEGRMAEPEQVVEAAVLRLCAQDLHERHLVVTAGPTVEDLDPVRYLGNRSSGRMGFALAERAAQRGARVTLIAGPVSCASPPGIRRVDVRSAVQMRQAVWEALGPDFSNADALIMAAAVADYRPAEPSDSKIRRESEKVTLQLVANPDLLAEVGRARHTARPILVGFALETGSDAEVLACGQRKLTQKSVDLVVANGAAESLEYDTTRAALITPASAGTLAPTSKADLAERILDWLDERFRESD
ncbi:bifunctional phosphopantothenoylcysteine decarboxylase/phosphopantothenate--cysteine ligase CoaBC [Myxococcota bacterium]